MNEKDRLIFKGLMEGKGDRLLRELYSCGWERIKKVKMFIQTNAIKQIGRTKILTPEIITFIELSTLQNASLSARLLREMILTMFNVQVGCTTINKARNELRFSFRTPRIKQFLSEEHKINRYQFAKDIQEKKISFNNLVFSDESRFCQSPDSTWRWIRRGDYNDTSYIEKKKFSNGIMFWGAIGLNYKSPLIECNISINSPNYIDILCQSGIQEECDALFGKYNWDFMQDGAPAHTAENTIQTLAPLFNILPGWPPNSPDLNPIELLWAIIKNMLKKYTFTNMQEYKAEVIRIWNAISIELINKLILSFQDRIGMIIQANGESIQSYVNNWYSNIPIKYQRDPNKKPSLFTEEEDLLLIEKVESIGPKWKKLTQYFPGRKDISLKYRYKCLSLNHKRRSLNIENIE